MKFNYIKNKSLKDISSIHIGGIARDYYEVYDEEALSKIVAMCKMNRRLFYVVGNGSKLLFPDGFIDVVIIKIKISNLELTEDLLNVGSGYSLSRLARELAAKNYLGFAGLSGIPASVGGAIVNNAGAYGDDISRYIESIKVLEDDEIKIIDKKDIVFAYRYSSFKVRACIILSATFRLKKSQENELNKCLDNEKKRKKTQPCGVFTLGSTFQNPKDTSIGQIIEQLEMKGMCNGDAKISETHGNFIENIGSATQKNVLYLIEIMSDRLYNKIGIMPKLEMIILRW